MLNEKHVHEKNRVYTCRPSYIGTHHGEEKKEQRSDHPQAHINKTSYIDIKIAFVSE